jgi:hypothetical protein
MVAAWQKRILYIQFRKDVIWGEEGKKIPGRREKVSLK